MTATAAMAVGRLAATAVAGTAAAATFTATATAAAVSAAVMVMWSFFYEGFGVGAQRMPSSLSFRRRAWYNVVRESHVGIPRNAILTSFKRFGTGN